MGSGPVQSNTNLSEIDRRRLEAGGPSGFIMAVFETLRRFDRPYFYTSAVPEWLGAGEATENPSSFAESYAEFETPPQGELDFKETPHAIIHRWRQYPSKRRYAGTTDSPFGARRQKQPSEVLYHHRPLPDGQADYLSDESVDPKKRRPFVRGTHEGEPPLWDHPDQVPDLIREFIDEETVCYVTPWQYDVFVDFTLVAANEYALQQMTTDFMLILRTFHDRAHTGASNLSGWFYQSVPGPSPDLDLRDDYPSRTITWRLQQTEAYAFPIDIVREIHLDLYSDNVS